MRRYLMVWVGLSGILGRFFITALIEPLGRRGAGTLACGMAALLTVSAGYLYNVFIGGWSLFYMLMARGNLFQQLDLHGRRALYVGDLAGTAAQQRHGHELWHRQSRRQGSRTGGLGGDHGGRRHHQAGGAQSRSCSARPSSISPRWYILGIIGFWVFGPETKGPHLRGDGQRARQPAGASRAMRRPPAAIGQALKGGARRLQRLRAPVVAPQEIGPELVEARAADLAHDQVDLAAEDVDCLLDPGQARRRPRRKASGRPKNTNCAPRHQAIRMSAPRRTPLSSITVTLSPTAALIAGNASSEAGAWSSWRPPWFETMIPSTPISAARTASAGLRMPLTTSGRGNRRR